MQAPRLAELTALQGRGGVLAVVLPAPMHLDAVVLLTCISPPTETPSCNKYPIHHAADSAYNTIDDRHMPAVKDISSRI